MKYSGILLIILFFSQIANCQEETITNSTPLDTVTGAWTVDLKPTKASEPYLKEFVISILEGTSFSGTFYETTFDNGHINTKWDRVYFAFSTKDSSSQYFHSGYIMDGKMHGLTYCKERGFTMPWTGRRKLKK